MKTFQCVLTVALLLSFAGYANASKPKESGHNGGVSGTAYDSSNGGADSAGVNVSTFNNFQRFSDNMDNSNTQWYQKPRDPMSVQPKDLVAANKLKKTIRIHAATADRATNADHADTSDISTETEEVAKDSVGGVCIGPTVNHTSSRGQTAWGVAYLEYGWNGKRYQWMCKCEAGYRSVLTGMSYFDDKWDTLTRVCIKR